MLISVRARALAAAFTLVLLLSPGAWGHGELQGTDPLKGQTLNKVPRRVSVTLTETPQRNARFIVVDGCKRTVSDAVAVEGNVLSATIEGTARPGDWIMSYRAISSEDGHLTDGSIRFKVAGKKDCSPDQEPPSSETPIPSDSPTGRADDPGGDGGSSPVLPIILGGTAILGLGLAVRLASGRR